MVSVSALLVALAQTSRSSLPRRHGVPLIPLVDQLGQQDYSDQVLSRHSKQEVYSKTLHRSSSRRLNHHVQQQADSSPLRRTHQCQVQLEPVCSRPSLQLSSSQLRLHLSSEASRPNPVVACSKINHLRQAPPLFSANRSQLSSKLLCSLQQMLNRCQCSRPCLRQARNNFFLTKDKLLGQRAHRSRTGCSV